MTRPLAPFLPYARQCVGDDDIDAVIRVLRSDWLTTGPVVAEFESALGAVTGAAHTLACSNGTTALQLAYEAMGLGSGDIIVVPAVTFLATANAARLLGAEVLFSDVDPDSGLIRMDDLAKALEGKQRARMKLVAPVHLGGQCADPEGIYRLAHANGLMVVEDACHAVGTEYGAGRYRIGSCAHSDAAVFSFHAVKTIAMGEGGAVTTNSDEVADRVRALRSHGMVRTPEKFSNIANAFDKSGVPNPWYYEMPAIGHNFRLTDIQCALGTSQLAKLPAFIARRRALAQLYDQHIAALAPHVKPVRRVMDCDPALHLYQVLIDFEALDTTRAALMRKLGERGIGTQVHYIPVHLQPYYANRYGPLSLPGAEAFYRRTLSLPLFFGMADDDVERVVQTMVDVLGLRGRR